MADPNISEAGKSVYGHQCNWVKGEVMMKILNEKYRILDTFCKGALKESTWWN